MATLKSRLRTYLNNRSSGDIKALENAVKDYKYVSFDIFDTLVKRDVPKPTDVFNIVGEKAGIEGFKDIRIKAELKARDNDPANEVNLEQIYDNLSGIKPEKRLQVMEAEKEIEIQVSAPNKEFVELYNRIIKNAEVILVSDMYLDTGTVTRILDHCGIKGYKKIYISNELGKNKITGGLYRHVLDDLNIKPSELIHIGNSYRVDYLRAKKCGIRAFKVSTDTFRSMRKYQNTLCPDNSKKQYLNAFINNHTPDDQDYYKRFGFECLGPLLYGFTGWLFEEMKKEGIEQVFFLSRDGYLMQKAYRESGYDKVIPDHYFEASRRSLRIPAFKDSMSYDEMLDVITLPGKTNVSQMIDSWGLDAASYKDILSSLNIVPDEVVLTKELKDSKKIRDLYDKLKDEISSNTKEELSMLEGYLKRFDLTKKTAIVDIGWRGSMQMYLDKTLSTRGSAHKLYGFYIGLREDSADILGANDLKARGYAFDCLNDPSAHRLERPFLGLIETPFLEQSGSVKRYVFNGTEYCSERYPYEFLGSDGKLTKEALSVKKIQDYAVSFVHEYKDSVISSYVGNMPGIMFSNFYETGTDPRSSDVKAFGDFDYFDNGDCFKLAKPKGFVSYILSPGKLKKDLYDSRWKVGFLKGLFKLPMDYLKMFNRLVKMK